MTEGRTDESAKKPRHFHLLKQNACIPHLRKGFEKKKSDLKYSVSCQTLILPDLPGLRKVIFTPLMGHLHIKQLHLLSLCGFMHSLGLRITKFHLSAFAPRMCHYFGSYFKGLQFFFYISISCVVVTKMHEKWAKQKQKSVSFHMHN